MIRKYLGLSKRYLSNLLNKPSVVLLYHRVTNLKNDPQSLAVSPENFYEQIDLVKKNYNLVTVEEFSSHLMSPGKMPRNAVLITFDDGYADNYHEALPILESLNSQALFFITTSNLNTDHELWWDELERIFLESSFLPPFIDIKSNAKYIRFPIANTNNLLDTYYSLHRYLKYVSPEQRNNIITSLRQSTGLSENGRKSHRLMTSSELKSLSDSSSSIIGAHTHNHPALSILPYEIQLQEIKTSKLILETTINKTIDHFSYPYGSKTDYNLDSVRASKALGFNFSYSNYYDHVHSWTDLFQIPRMLVRNWDRHTFKKFISKSFKY